MCCNYLWFSVWQFIRFLHWWDHWFSQPIRIKCYMCKQTLKLQQKLVMMMMMMMVRPPQLFGSSTHYYVTALSSRIVVVNAVTWWWNMLCICTCKPTKRVFVHSIKKSYIAASATVTLLLKCSLLFQLLNWIFNSLSNSQFWLFHWFVFWLMYEPKRPEFPSKFQCEGLTPPFYLSV